MRFMEKIWSWFSRAFNSAVPELPPIAPNGLPNYPAISPSVTNRKYRRTRDSLLRRGKVAHAIKLGYI